MGGEASIEVDVYNYGILLLEMFLGKRPTNDMFKDGLNLHNFAKMALPESLFKFLIQSFYQEKLMKLQQQLWQLENIMMAMKFK